MAVSHAAYGLPADVHPRHRPLHGGQRHGELPPLHGRERGDVRREPGSRAVSPSRSGPRRGPFFTGRATADISSYPRVVFCE